jgi:hypothetical protein
MVRRESMTEPTVEEIVGERWGNGCFAERKKWGECPDSNIGEKCPYCWGLFVLRAAEQAERERCAVIAENVKHPVRGSDVGPGKRERFYQTHIRHAWAQAGHHIAAAIRGEGR